ncbi:MAG: DNA repair protein RecO [Candidatus Delongbacteria bacterium]|jgi:DNA repair protein RecO (recombination protein O)|nr:DNA repair protein RecO [Candidatus Delongbacteria bacterium]
MLVKTKAVVINRLNYSDSRIITHVLTPELGKIALMVNKSKGKKSNGKAGYFQSLHLLNLEFSYKEKRNIQQLIDAQIAARTNDLAVNFHKQNVVILLAEILNRCIKEMEPDQELFQYVWHAVLMFDELDKAAVNFHLYFLTHLMKYLGFEPGNQWNDHNKYLDMDAGLFVGDANISSSCLTEKESSIIYRFMNYSGDEIPHNGVSNTDRRLGIEAVLSYFNHHIPNFGRLKSYDVLKAVYH